MNRANRIRAARAEYLAMRRTLGYQLTDPEHLLQQFVDYLDTIGADSITIDNALTWARQPAGADPYWWSVRLSTVRVFARYLHAVDPDLAQPIPPRLLPTRPCRAVPYLYSEQQVLAIMNATDRLRKPLRRVTVRTLIGLLAVTGMRVGEAIAADVTDLDLTRGTIRVTGKLGPGPSTSAAPEHLPGPGRLPATTHHGATHTENIRALRLQRRHPPDLQLRSEHLRQARRAGRRVRHLPPLPPPHT